MIRSVVVLPQPEGPSRQTTSPGATARSTSRTAVKAPKRLVTRRSSIVDISGPRDGRSRPARSVLTASA